MDSVNNDKQNYLERVSNFLKNGQRDEALSVLLDYNEKFPNEPDINFMIGNSYFMNQDLSSAIQYVKQAIYYDEYNDKYLAFAGKIYYRQKKIEDSYNYSKSANEINPDNIEALLTLGSIEYIKHNFNSAINFAQRAFKLDENNFQTMVLLARCNTTTGKDLKFALELFEKVREIQYFDEIQIDIIRTLDVLGLYDECIKECERFIAKNPNSNKVQKIRGFIDKIKNKQVQQKKEVAKSEKSKDDEVKRQSSSLEEALDKLNSLTGLEEVKNEIDRIVMLIQYERYRTKELGIVNENAQSYHFMFLGNPGTGKTTVARLIGDIFYYLGLLEKGHMVECDRSTLVGQYIGQTAILTKQAIDSAMGGVLFIDEAYSLARGGTNSKDFGPEAIDTLIKTMEDCRGKFIVILAGYTKEMRAMMKLNPGLKSRVNINIKFADYSVSELLTIGKNIAEKNYYYLNSDAEKAFIEQINKFKVDDSFANARTARNLIESAIREKAFRIGNKSVSREELSILQPEDFGINLNDNPINKVENLLKELNEMTGLDEVKSMVSQIVNLVQYQQKKKELGYESDEISLNMIFSGNPGTGKTTIARIVSKIFNAMGILKKGQLVEVTRADLVGQHIGETGIKTLDKIKEAYGGVLFIDEAYSLNSKSESDFGKEAISTLIKEMEDNRDRLLVIMAGYTDEMKELQNMNPGIKSRIGFTVKFEDYNPTEMIKIFNDFCAKGNYKLELNAELELFRIFKYLYDNRDRNFGNARLVRQYFEQIKMKQAERVITNNISVENMFNIIEEDIKELVTNK